MADSTPNRACRESKSDSLSKIAVRAGESSSGLDSVVFLIRGEKGALTGRRKLVEIPE